MGLGMTAPAALLLGVVGIAAVASAHAESATYYGHAGYYNGRTMACGGTYWASDPTIVAVGYSRAQELPCGAQVLIEGPAGSLIATVSDRCPGCGHNTFDLSDEGNRQVCGVPAHTCTVVVSRP